MSYKPRETRHPDRLRISKTTPEQRERERERNRERKKSKLKIQPEHLLENNDKYMDAVFENAFHQDTTNPPWPPRDPALGPPPKNVIKFFIHKILDKN